MVLVFTQLMTGLALAHAAWLYFFLCGTLIYTPAMRGGRPLAASGSGESLLRVIAASTAGIVITGLVTFPLGLLHGLYAWMVPLLLVVLGAIFDRLGDSPLRAAFWQMRAEMLRDALSVGAGVVYALALYASLPAILPETQFDPLFTYYTVSVEWAHHHAIYVDYWRRLPFYAVNWLLITTWVWVLGVQQYAAFLTWLSGALTLLGIYAYVTAQLQRMRFRMTLPFAIDTAGVLAAVALDASAVFLRWLDCGMNDVPEGLCFFVAFACAGMLFATARREWLAPLVLSAAFLIGMKTSLFVCLPVFALVVFFGALRVGIARRGAAIALAVFAVLSLPWYVKSFIQAGDPIDPVLNIAVTGRDGKFSKADMAAQLSDLQRRQTIARRLTIPQRAVNDQLNEEFREAGFTFASVAIVPVMAIALFGALRRRRIADPLAKSEFVTAALILFAVSYWLETSHLGRYMLLFFPALAAFAVIVVARHAARYRYGLPLTLAVAAFLAVPASTPAYNALLQGAREPYGDIAALVAVPQRYLQQRIDGIDDGEYLAAHLGGNLSNPPHVYLIGASTLDYFFALHDITPIGDWFGPERFPDLDTAIIRGAGAAHLARFGIDAVLMSSSANSVAPELQALLAVQLRAAGYREISRPKSAFRIFLKPRSAA